MKNKVVYVVGESWCPFTKEAWNITPDSDMDIKKVDCGRCSRLENTTYDGTTTTREICINACDGSFGYPAYFVESRDGQKINLCGHGFNNQNAAMRNIRSCMLSYGIQ